MAVGKISIKELLESRKLGKDIPQYTAPTTPKKLPPNPSTIVFITAASTNTGYIAWGFSPSVPNLLDAGQSITLPLSNSDLIYVQGNGTDKVGGSVLR